MYDTVSTAVAQAVQNVDSNDSNVKQSYNAFEFNFQARLPHGARLFGGTATDRTIANTCAGAASNPNFLLTIGGVNYCDQTNSGIPWRTQFKLAGTFPLPWWGITTAASFQALPGYILGTSALTAGGAGAPIFTTYSGTASTWTVTPTTNYVVCPGNSASQGCVVGARVVPAGINSGIVHGAARRARHAADAARQPARPVVQQADHRGGHQVRSEDRHLQRAELGRLLHSARHRVLADHQSRRSRRR